MKQATKDAGKSADAALKTAEATAAAERAYVFVNVKILDPATHAPVFPSRIIVYFCNLGKTPAIITMLKAYTMTSTGMVHVLPPHAPGGVDAFEEGLVIAAGERYQVPLTTTIEDRQAVATGSTFFCCGLINYKTVLQEQTPFQGTKTTGYCWQYAKHGNAHSFDFSHTGKLNHYN